MTDIDPALLSLAGWGLPGASTLSTTGWAERIDAVVAQGLSGFLHEAWSAGSVELDDATIRRVGDQLAAEATRAVRIEGELIRLEPLMAWLPSVVLKGAVLAHGAYPDPQLRPFTDLDLLTPGWNLQTAVAALARLGYERTRPEPAPGFDARVGKAVTLEHPGGVVVDLHRTLAPGVAGAAVDVDELVASRISIEIGPVAVAAPSWEAHLVEAALHAVIGDGLSRPMSLRDVAQLAMRPDLDISGVVELARRWKVTGPVGAGLLIAARSFGLVLQPDLVALAAESAVTYPVTSQPAGVRSARNRLDELQHGDLRRRLTLARALVAPSPAFLRWTYGVHPLASLYGRRWRDLVRREAEARVGSPPEPLPPQHLAPQSLPSSANDGLRASRPTATLPSHRTARPAVAVAGSWSPPTPLRLPRPASVVLTRPRASLANAVEHSGDAVSPPRQRRWTAARPPRVVGSDAGRTRLHRPEPAEAPPDSPGPEQPNRALPGGRSGVTWFFGGTGLLVSTATASQLGANRVGLVCVPVAAMCLAVAASRRIVARHPDEDWIGRWLVLGILAKLVASYIRYFTLVVSYQGVGDASGYDSYGRQFARAWLGDGSAPELPDLRRTNFLRWFTGVVYYLFGSNMIAGFFIFGLLAAVGSYFWYRATVSAIGSVDKRLYFALVFFAPSIAFWPSSIGKEALMQLGIGTIALGTSFLLRQHLTVGVAIGAAGGWLLWVVRPHLLALVTIAAACAYIVGRVRGDAGVSSVLGRPIGLVIVILLMAFTVSQGAKFLGVEHLSLSSIQAELDAQTERSSQGGSEFDNSGSSLNPLNLPRGAVTVLLRPFPWETDSSLQLLASLESALLVVFIVVRLPSLRAALTHARRTPYLLNCWVLTILYAATFSSFANFGLLVRQRSLVLPAFFVLLSVRRGPEPAGVEPADDFVPTRSSRGGS